MNSIIIGASAGIGKALAYELAKHGHQLILVSSDERDLISLCNDISISYDTSAKYIVSDLKNLDLKNIVSQIKEYCTSINNIFLIAGVSNLDPTRDRSSDINEIIDVNLKSPILIMESLFSLLDSTGAANIVGLGSIAAIRARSTRLIYASCKKALEFYFQGLMHKFSQTNVKIQFYRLGYAATQMTYGQNLAFPAIRPENAAKIILRRLDKNIELGYIPGWWRYICWTYHALPWFIFKRMKA
mgnify:CR=1 FL=1